MKMLLLRHAESNGNASGGDYSVADADALSPTGVAQSDALAGALESWDIDKVIVSPQRRAIQTIAPYLAKRGRTGEVWPELAEACWQEEREPPAEAWHSAPTALPDDIAQYFTWRDGQAIRPAPQESFGMGLRRVLCAIERIENSFGRTDQTILMVSHRHFIREMLNLMQTLLSPEAFDHDNCGMTRMTFGTKWELAFCNRQPHREAEPVLRPKSEGK